MKNKQSSAGYLQDLFKKSAIALQNGDAAAAKKGFEKVSKKVKDNALVWYNLGLSNQYLGEHHHAVQAYRKAVSVNPGMNDALVNLGISYQLLGELEKAVNAAEKVLGRDQNHIRANNLLGSLLAEQGKPEEAKEPLGRSFSMNPDDPETRFNMANLELTLGNTEKAREVLQPLITAFPEEKKYLALQGQILIYLKDFDSAVRLITKLKERYGDEESLLRLDLSLREESRSHFNIIDLCRKLLENHPEDAQLWNSLGNAYFQLDSVEQAKEYYEKAIELDPRHPKYCCNLGLAYSSLGDKENAEKYYRLSIECDPGHAEAYRHLVAMKRYRSMEEDDVRSITKLWDNRLDYSTAHNIELAFAIGKIYDDCGDYVKSFEAYEVGNNLKFAESSIDLEKYFSHIDRIPEILDVPPKNTASIRFDHQPIFVLGMPRSGTTLVEQILSRHPDVTGCGELPCIERAINRLEKDAGSARVYPDDFRELASSTLDKESEEYRSWVARLHDIETPYYIDKMPFNFVHIWLIKALFPDSPVINCQRHPLDVVVSNYFQLYGSDVSFVYNLEALANYYVRYFRLMEHWNRIFADGIYNVIYENLVTDHEAQTRKLIDGAGLPWNDNCLDSKKSETAVRTASIWQVRQGIYTRSKERWRNYEEQIRPAADILVRENILDEDWGFVLL